MTEGAAGPLRSLDPKAITLWRVESAGWGLGLIALAAVAEILFDLPLRNGILTIPMAIAVIAIIVVVPPIRHQAWRFALQEDHIYLRHGVLFRTTSIVPYARIQHVDTRHGPLDRWLGLASLVIFTAGTRGAIITIPALPAEESEQLRDHLAALSGAGDAV